MFVIVEMVFGVHAEIPCTPRTGTLPVSIRSFHRVKKVRKSSPHLNYAADTTQSHQDVYDHSDNMGAARLCGALSLEIPVRRRRV
jgi:hypothetical protein